MCRRNQFVPLLSDTQRSKWDDLNDDLKHKFLWDADNIEDFKKLIDSVPLPVMTAADDPQPSSIVATRRRANSRL